MDCLILFNEPINNSRLSPNGQEFKRNTVIAKRVKRNFCSHLTTFKNF